MAKQRSAGILMYRRVGGELELLLLHPGGPFWANKDLGVWSIPKGLYEDNEDPFDAARREFKEETGMLPKGKFTKLGEFKQPHNKTISAWAVEANFDVGGFISNFFSLEWPPKSGRIQEFPEADRAAWFRLAEAQRKILKGQIPIISALLRQLKI